MAEAICVDPGRIGEVWGAVSHWIKEAVDRCDLGTFAIVERDVLSGKSLLWLAWDGKILGAAITQVYLTEKSKVCEIVACGGNDGLRWSHLIEQLENYARAQGCHSTRIMARKGWLRALKNYRAKMVILERRL